MTRPPDFEELIGTGLETDERERLRSVHELLVATGPPPELPPALQTLPAERSAALLPRRRRFALIAIAASLAAAAFGGGFLVGGRDATPQYVVALAGTELAQEARGAIEVLPADADGNWPMRVTVSNLAAGTYELWLTKGGRPAESCGRFAITGTKASVTLSVPYKLKDYDGWIVTRRGSTRPLLTT